MFNLIEVQSLLLRVVDTKKMEFSVLISGPNVLHGYLSLVIMIGILRR